MASAETLKTGMKTFGISCDINLDDIINSAISDLCDPEKSDDAKNWEIELQKIQTQVRTAERKQKDVTRIFSNCMSELVSFREALEEEAKDDHNNQQLNLIKSGK